MSSNPGVSAIIAAAGSGTRLGRKTPKQFLNLEGRPVLAWSMEAFSSTRIINEIILVVPQDIEHETIGMLNVSKYPVPVSVVSGGPTRYDSVLNGLQATMPTCEMVAIHDAARPFVTTATIESVCLMAKEIGAAIVARPVHDTVKEVDASGLVVRTLQRETLVLAQTPQVCRKQDLLMAYEKAKEMGVKTTDEAGLLELMGLPVGIVEGSCKNFKITNEDDMRLARALARLGNQAGLDEDTLNKFTP